ncbi:hypothetical protein [Roseibium aquae]|nr:hypothetical protein [Roseibium aquae]
MLKRMFQRQWRHSARTGASHVDPLDHPAIQRMSQRELADLPLQRR